MIPLNQSCLLEAGATQNYISRMFRLSALVLSLLAPIGAQAHPHIFIDAGLVLEVDADGNAVSVEVTWGYDELYSLLILEEYEVDDDYDGVLKPEEAEKLLGFDAQWVEGFEGDLYATLGDQKVALGTPEPTGLTVENGKVISRHKRSLDVPAEGLVLQVYDPGFYSAYSLTLGVEIRGDCSTTIDQANVNEAMSELEELLFARPQSELETEFPEVGRKFADTVTVSCN